MIHSPARSLLLGKTNLRKLNLSCYSVLVLRILNSYGDILLASGHPHHALQYRLWGARLLTKKFKLMHIKSKPDWSTEDFADPEIRKDFCVEIQAGLAPNSKEWKNQVAMMRTTIEQFEESVHHVLKTLADVTVKRTAEDMRDIIQSLRLAADLMTDTGVSITEPILFRRIEDFQAVDGTSFFWEDQDDRSKRVVLANRLFMRSFQVSKLLTKCSASQQDIERLTRARIRRLVNKLQWLCRNRFDGLEESTAGIRGKDRQMINKLKLINTQCDQALENIRGGPNNNRRKRHKCYLYLIKARADAAMGQWHSAGVNYARAQASLARAAGAAELSAFAVVCMFHAESCLLEAEAAMIKPPTSGSTSTAISDDARARKILDDMAKWGEGCLKEFSEAIGAGNENEFNELRDRDELRIKFDELKIILANRSPDERLLRVLMIFERMLVVMYQSRERNMNRPLAFNEFENAMLVFVRDVWGQVRSSDGVNEQCRLYRECELLLQQARPVLEKDSRSENRWRVFYKYLNAKLLWRRAQLYEGERQDVLLFDAFREVVSGLTNTGLRTDRRVVLKRLMNRIVATSFVFNNEKSERNRVRLGLPQRGSGIDRKFYFKFVEPA